MGSWLKMPRSHIGPSGTSFVVWKLSHDFQDSIVYHIWLCCDHDFWSLSFAYFYSFWYLKFFRNLLQCHIKCFWMTKVATWYIWIKLWFHFCSDLVMWWHWNLTFGPQIFAPISFLILKSSYTVYLNGAVPQTCIFANICSCGDLCLWCLYCTSQTAFCPYLVFWWSRPLVGGDLGLGPSNLLKYLTLPH